MEQNERIATLETQLNSVVKGMERIETKLDAYSANFLPRSEADFKFGKVEDEIKEIKQNKRANLSLTVSVLAVAVTFIFALINLLR